MTFLATQERARDFFQKINLPVRPVKNALIARRRCDRLLLSQELLENKVRVRIVERDPAAAMQLARNCRRRRS